MMHTLTRRAALQHIGTAAALPLAFSSLPALADEAPAKSSMGLVIYDCGLRRKWMQKQNPDFDLYEPLTFLKHCRSLGAGGMQARLGILEPAAIRKLRDYAEAQQLYIEAIVSPPASDAELGRFEKEIKTAVDARALAARTVIMPGRRYERFQTLDEFQEYETRGIKMLERAAPIVEKLRLPLAVENHKDQRIDARVALFKHLDSEFIGACVDTGNSFALLDDPYGAVEALAPYAFSVHLKDQALLQYEDGFLLGDIPLGQGAFDLKRMVNLIKQAKPDVRFSLELITRDPLKVPVLTEGYWATLAEVPGQDLARTLRIVREHPADNLQYVTKLPPQKQVELEDANVASSLKYAREELGLVPGA
jgi:sugar phosphate isomerase/epimerase